MQGDHRRLMGGLEDFPEGLRPSLEGVPFLARELMSLVDPYDSRAAAFDMAEDVLGHHNSVSKPLDPRGNRAPDVMQAPVLHSGKLVHAALGPAKATDMRTEVSSVLVCREEVLRALKSRKPLD